ncbi:hypothetical protein [Flavivirga eckloniae]|uniref:Secretion system C-terminal sorting domain-containing protein n=1 Tax=Flavivirga eckloniae TaxID=1803846 RepID=A0A2K9PQF4_9FLAO|nr:hypothetical protein [Flavivirga eckloniae]AUP79291.1 hypothetical protein C1H87_11475 [Flavivirga eckloniae]
MKKVIRNIKKTLLTVAMLTAMIGNANEISSFKTKEGLKGTALTIENVKEGDLLSIRNYNGIIIYKELIQSSGTYEKGFDLTELPNGDYFFEIDKDLKIKTIPFTVKENNVVFNKEKEVVVFKPYIREKNDLVFITKLALNLEPLKIRIYGKYDDGSFVLLSSEKISGVQNIERVYKLKKGGDYKIELDSDNKKFTKFINRN